MRLPPVNWLLRLDVVPEPEASPRPRPDAVGLPSRVEDVDGDVLVVAAPHLPGSPVLPGAHVCVHWTEVRGLHATAMVLHERVPGVVPLWRLRAAGDVQVVQRRRYVRVPFASEISVVPRGERLGVVAGGLVADLSEGGVRVLLGSAVRAEAGSEVTVVLQVDGQPLELLGEVVRCSVVRGPAPYEVVVSFLPPVPHADLLRRAVLRRQIEQRRGVRR